MKERIKNWITTIAGLIIIFGGITIWLLGKIDTTALTICVPFGLTLIVAKDTLITEGILQKKSE